MRYSCDKQPVALVNIANPTARHRTTTDFIVTVSFLFGTNVHLLHSQFGRAMGDVHSPKVGTPGSVAPAPGRVRSSPALLATNRRGRAWEPVEGSHINRRGASAGFR